MGKKNNREKWSKLSRSVGNSHDRARTEEGTKEKKKTQKKKDPVANAPGGKKPLFLQHPAP